MAAVGILLIGIGPYLMYDAFKSTTPAPVTNAKNALSNLSGSTSGPGTGSSGTTPVSVSTLPDSGLLSGGV